MKYMIASDIHGSALYCGKMLRAYEREHADRLLLLGDILYHGPRNDLPEEYSPKEVAAMLNGSREKLLCIRGNCDAEVDQMVLQFPILADYALISECGRTYYLSHGHIYNEKNLPPLMESDVFIYGHTHVPRADRQGKRVFFNPGSVSLPKEGNPPSYGILEDGKFLVKTFEGTVLRELRP